MLTLHGVARDVPPLGGIIESDAQLEGDRSDAREGRQKRMFKF